MPEQAIPTLLGAMGTALVTAVGALAWMVQQRRNGHHSDNPGLEPTLKELCRVLERQATGFEQLTKEMEKHNTEAPLRHDALVTAINNLRERG